MSEAARTDPATMARWVQDSSALPHFWTASPTWTAGTARVEVDGQLVAWSEAGGLIAVSDIAAAVAVHLDGTATLAELAEDLAAVTEAPADAARAAVAAMAVELQAWGAVEGVPVTEPPALDGAAPTEPGLPREDLAVDPATGAEIRVVTEWIDGQEVITEHLPDGSRRVTTVMTMQSGSAAGDAVEAVAAAVLAGERSPAELVPADSCLGAKLRDGDDVPLLSFRGADGRLRSVRCHDDEVADALARRAGDRWDRGPDRGPVVAFVVTPLEGSGPVRIYDGRGARRGRPRSATDAADVVDQLLGEHEATHPEGSGSGLPLSAVLVTRGEEGVLVPLGNLSEPRVAQRLRWAGWNPTWGSAVLHDDGTVAPPTGLDAAPSHRPARLSALGLAPTGRAAAVVTALGGQRTRLSGAVALPRLVDLAVRLLAAEPPSDEPWASLQVTAEPAPR